MRQIGKIIPASILLAALVVSMAALQGMKSGPEGLPQVKSIPQPQTVTEETKVLSIVIPQKEHRLIGAELAAGEEVVVRQGDSGMEEQTVRITYRNGKESSRTVLSKATVQQPTDRIVLYGVDRTASVQTHPAEPLASDGILTTPEGDRLAYTGVLSCSATAYSCEGFTGTTAIGTTARVGAVAVDPNYIPYGTKLYIVSNDGAYIYGVATAEDCGNFRGYHIDLYFNTVDECWAFGRRNCTVYILK